MHDVWDRRRATDTKATVEYSGILPFVRTTTAIYRYAGMLRIMLRGRKHVCGSSLEVVGSVN